LDKYINAILIRRHWLGYALELKEGNAPVL